ncbi:MAG: glycerol-3-phosphate 1-O-acyltransferase PlsY [Bacteroidales bacterium]|nr:glycerol-3-phosphate 1-O-acyltransferase PlsY [Bacteroidales bacterium]
MQALLCLLTAYLIGSIPTGYLLVKARTGADLRREGSGSTGATNAGRFMQKTKGDKAARAMFLAVMAADIIKGTLPVLAAIALFHNDLCGITAAFGAVIGHSKSCFLHFKGGKSVATGWGTLLAFQPLAWLCSFILWCILTHTTKYVSVASIAAFAVAPVLMALFGASTAQIVYSAATAIYIIALHHQNISRLRHGTENKTNWL